MSANTIDLNQQMTDFDHCDSVWLFGYGSLIYKADFPFLEKRPASIRDWNRRFWQGSHDHRGTPEAPGRVVTLAPAPGAVCHGLAYRITPQEFAHLDHREKNGYLRVSAEMTFDDGNQVEGLIYIAREDNAAYLGPASEEDIARHIARSKGPSGHNCDYLFQLTRSLRQLCGGSLTEDDTHLAAIEQHLLSRDPTV